MCKSNIFTCLIAFLTLMSCHEKVQTNNHLNVEGTQKNEIKVLKMLGHWAGEGKKELLIREITREFSLLNQDVQLELKFPQQVYSYNDESELFGIEYQDIVNMVKTNNWPYDVLLCDQERYRFVGDILKDPEWGKKYLVDFSSEPWFEEVHKADIFASGEYKKKYGGIVPGPLLEGISNVMFISEDVEKLLGIKVKRLDMGFSDFLSYAQSVYNYNLTHSEKITFFSTQCGTAIASLLSQLVQSEYEKTVFSSRKESLDVMLNVYDKLEKIAAYKPVEQYTTFGNMTYDAAQRTLKEEKFLFNMEPSWMYLIWNNLNHKGTVKMKPCEIPSMDGKVSPNYSGFYQVIFVVPKNCKNVDAAKRFIKFISSCQTAETWIKYSKCPTGLKSKISYSDFGQEEFELFYRHLQKKYGNNQKDVNLSKLMFNTDKTIEFNAEAVLQGKMKAAEALKKLEKQIY